MKQYLITSEEQIVARFLNALQVLKGRAMTQETLDMAQSLLSVCLHNMFEEGVLVEVPEIQVVWNQSAQAMVLDFPQNWEACIAKGMP